MPPGRDRGQDGVFGVLGQMLRPVRSVTHFQVNAFITAGWRELAIGWLRRVISSTSRLKRRQFGAFGT